jgi:hypothetical protein
MHRLTILAVGMLMSRLRGIKERLVDNVIFGGSERDALCAA